MEACHFDESRGRRMKGDGDVRLGQRIVGGF